MWLLLAMCGHRSPPEFSVDARLHFVASRMCAFAVIGIAKRTTHIKRSSCQMAGMLNKLGKAKQQTKTWSSIMGGKGRVGGGEVAPLLFVDFCSLQNMILQ